MKNKNPETKNIFVQVDPELHRRLKTYCARHKTDIKVFVAKLVNDNVPKGDKL